MILKIFKGVWFLSLIGLLASLLLVYASMQETVVVQEEGINQVILTKDTFFYIVLALMVIVNVMVFPVKKLFLKNEPFRTWVHGLLIAINIFFIVGLSLINSFNSGERFDFSRIGFVVYGSVGLIVIWAFAWPAYQLYKRFTPKSAI